MNCESLLEHIRHDLTAAGGRDMPETFTPISPPRPIAPLLDAALDDEEKLEFAGSFTAFPAGALQLIGEAELLETLFSFDWSCLGPMSTCAGLCLVGNDEASWLVFWDEYGGPRAVAALSPGKDKDSVAAAVLAYIACKPVYGEVIPFGSLPENTLNHRPEWVPSSAVEDAYREHLDRDSAGPADWRSFVDAYISKRTEPDHLQRSLSLLRGFAGMSTEIDAREGLHQHQRPEQPSLVVCDTVFDEWWERAYSECRSR